MSTLHSLISYVSIVCSPDTHCLLSRRSLFVVQTHDICSLDTGLDPRPQLMHCVCFVYSCHRSMLCSSPSVWLLLPSRNVARTRRWGRIRRRVPRQLGMYGCIYMVQLSSSVHSPQHLFIPVKTCTMLQLPSVGN